MRWYLVLLANADRRGHSLVDVEFHQCADIEGPEWLVFPVATLVWCGRVRQASQVETAAGDVAAVEALAEAIEKTTPLRAADVQEVGLARFDPARHFRTLATRSC